MKTTRRARVIAPFRSSGVDEPGYSRPQEQGQQRAQQPPARSSASLAAPQRPKFSKALQDAADAGLRTAGKLAYVLPRFSDTKGSWVRVGAHQCRVPQNAIVSVIRSRDGREFGVVAGTHADDGKLQILADTADGVRELVGLPPGALADIRRVVFG